ncbi:MAG TPA: HAD-IIB family hydrolase [Sphingomonas sp.]|nr:HAD-IIB family hydrolase [Sphingomonas sp.]
MKRLVAFDLDGTLADSKQPISGEMAGLLANLLGVADVAVISGGDWPQFEKQVVGRMPGNANFARLWIMPTTGAKLYRPGANGAWQPVYADNFSDAERHQILAALDKAVEQTGLKAEKTWGEQIEDRGTQITFSGLGQQAPLDAKTAWDPDFTKRKTLQAALKPLLPGLSVNVGGSTSIDITREGVDKGWGLHRLAKESGISLGEMIFLGDAIYPGGNDYPAQEAGVASIKVHDPDDTATAIRAITLALS